MGWKPQITRSNQRVLFFKNFSHLSGSLAALFRLWHNPTSPLWSGDREVQENLINYCQYFPSLEAARIMPYVDTTTIEFQSDRRHKIHVLYPLHRISLSRSYVQGGSYPPNWYRIVGMEEFLIEEN